MLSRGHAKKGKLVKKENPEFITVAIYKHELCVRQKKSSQRWAKIYQTEKQIELFVTL